MTYRLLHIKDIPVIARVADCPTSREKGLMGVSHLAPNEGCLFCFGTEQHATFWMKNCKIDLQAIAINKQGQIVDIFNMKYADPYYIHKSSQPVTHVLEMPSEFFTNNNIRVGDSIKLEY